ncbi:nSTAND3 domain-containing NTPase [Flavobacterium sp. HNIBRBA15423]|uniref:nSTAND3 domain-containing NTPase n=1 Tax=Flavobacterium sp. HNIBRBA15423 TaxID=3458683 RepID=UPI00404448DA
MPDYNFLNLSPPEFEELSRDLLQKHLGVHLESFTSGRDSGIDLRHSFNPKDKLIIQCKRYKDFNSLYNKLKKEIPKVTKLNPIRYILTTSVGLTPNQKDEIITLLNPFIQSSSDIFGRDDLNNLLGQFPEIEKLHFKLWLSSTNILERILHSKIHNQSSFEEEKVKETVRVYVENKSYYQALEIIKSKKYVIISGMPGIGKTTLARILVYHYLANGFDEFVFLSDSINDGYDLYKENTKQVFLFDDFLGRNFLDKKLSNNEEQRIIRFIEKVSSSNDKVLILTTREYILAQAKLRYDIFENPSLEFAKCVIDLSQYTKFVRAKILYNHLFFAKISESHLADILDKKTYAKIINHPNYNPRVIETITHPDVWKHIKPEEFSIKFIDFLNYPESIWKHVYENQISKFSQCVLANLMTAGVPILLDDLKQLIQNFAKTHSKKYEISYSEIDFKKSIRELENTFISIKKDSINKFAVDYQNPSVQDFLVNYFKEFPDYIKDIINSSIYFNQLFKIFAIEEYYQMRGETVQRKNRIILKGNLKEIYINKILTDFDFLNTSVISRVTFSATNNSQWYKKQYSDYTKINEITKEFLVDEHPIIKQFILDRFQSIIEPNDLSGEELGYYINILDQFKDECTFDKNETIKSFSKNIVMLQQTQDFERFEDLFPDEYQEFIESDEDFLNNIEELMKEESSNAEEYYLEDTLYEIKSVGDKFGIDYYGLKEKIEERMEAYKTKQEEEYNWDDEKKESSYEPQNENDTIRDMFDSLRTELNN